MRKIAVLTVACLASIACADVVFPAATGPTRTATALDRDLVAAVPYDGIITYGSSAQNFEAAYDAYDIQPFMDFTTSADYYLGAVTSEGFETGGLDNPGGSTFEIWSDFPWNGGSVILSANGTDTLFSSGTIDADFAGALLPAGTYLLSAYANRDYATYGQSYLYQSPLGNNNDWHWNPGEGFGSGEYWQITDEGGANTDLNFVLQGTLVPEPASLILLSLAGLIIRRR